MDYKYLRKEKILIGCEFDFKNSKRLTIGHVIQLNRIFLLS